MHRVRSGWPAVTGQEGKEFASSGASPFYRGGHEEPRVYSATCPYVCLPQ